MLADVSGAVAYLDDIIIMGKNEVDHKNNLEAVLKSIREYVLRARWEKCKFFETEVKYLGMTINKDGRKPDPERTEKIIEMPPPTNITELRSSLGMINYYGNFTKELGNCRSPLDEL